MKNWITLVAIILSFAILAQHGKGKGNQGGNKGNKGNKGMQIHPGKTPKMHQGNGKAIKINPGKNKPGKNNVKIKPGKSKGKQNKHIGKPLYHSKYHYKKGHVNHVYMYPYTPFVYPTKNYGQWRSQQARNKHKAYPVVLELNVLNGILLIRERNAFLLSEIDRKIKLFHSLVLARHRAGLITEVQLNIHLATIKKMKSRRAYYRY